MADGARSGRRRGVVHAEDVAFDETFDIVVVGAGMAGLSAGLTATAAGARTVVLEKGPVPGGTMRKSAAWYWVPNNSLMRAAGVEDDREGALRYMARLSRPQDYDPRAEWFGMSAWEFALMEAFYDHASEANDALASMGAIVPMYGPDVPDYHSEIPEETVPYGRTLFPEAPDGEPGKGEELTRQLVAGCESHGVPLRMATTVTGVTVDADGAVVGVTVDGGTALRARRAVIFTSGGFTHDRELRKHFLQPGIFGGCAAQTNTGDFVRIATELGAPLRNMNFAWMAPIPLEVWLSGSPYLSGIFAVPGDSMIFVNKYGRRVLNEKAPYNEQALAFFAYDPQRLEYPNLVLMMIWDQRSHEVWRATEVAEETTPTRLALDNYGNVIYDGEHVIRGDTLDELTRNIDKRLGGLASETGGFALAPEFGDNLLSTIHRFNEGARAGRDPDFGRGSTPIQHTFNGPAREGNETGNATMYPIREKGPYYATLVVAGTLDTKGGPRITANGEVLGADDAPIPGLYGAGNCVASPSAQGYWAGGATLGPAMTFGYLAARHAAGRPVRDR